MSTTVARGDATVVVMGLMAYGAFLYSFFHDQQMPGNYEKAITITFISLVFGQFANLLSRRTIGNITGKYLVSNIKLLLAMLFSVSSILLIVYIPWFNLYFHTAPLRAIDWLLPVSVGIICLLIYEVKKKVVSSNT